MFRAWIHEKILRNQRKFTFSMITHYKKLFVLNNSFVYKWSDCFANFIFTEKSLLFCSNFLIELWQYVYKILSFYCFDQWKRLKGKKILSIIYIITWWTLLIKKKRYKRTALFGHQKQTQWNEKIKRKCSHFTYKIRYEKQHFQCDHSKTKSFYRLKQKKMKEKR